jgi:hypothetical protein
LVLAGNLPAPDPILPSITFPPYATHGIPKVQQDASSTLPKMPLASDSGVITPSALLRGQEEDDILLEQDAFKQQLLEVTPGSTEAEDLMDNVEATVKKISPRTKTTASFLGILAKVLWKDCQGIFQGCFCCFI